MLKVEGILETCWIEVKCYVIVLSEDIFLIFPFNFLVLLFSVFLSSVTAKLKIWYYDAVWYELNHK